MHCFYAKCSICIHFKLNCIFESITNLNKEIMYFAVYLFFTYLIGRKINRYILLPFLLLCFISVPLPLSLYFSVHLNVFSHALHQHLIQLLSYLLPSIHLIPLLWTMYARDFVSSGSNILLVGEGKTFSKASNPALFLFKKYETM